MSCNHNVILLKLIRQNRGMDMSVQDKIEHILRNIHLLFSECAPYENSATKIIVEKQVVFELLEQLNLAVYEAMDEYEVTSQKHDLAERRCEKRGEEIIQKASKHADDIYAASIMYTDDAINRICYIMDDANHAVKDIFHKMNHEIEEQRERVRRNQLELTGQLQDFADTGKYVKLIAEVNKQLEQEQRQKATGKKERRIQNEGKSYSAVKPEIKINKAYFERTGKSYELDIPEQEEEQEETDSSLARVTGREFAESLRRRAERKRAREIEVEDMSRESEKEPEQTEEKAGLQDILEKAGAGLAALVKTELEAASDKGAMGASAEEITAEESLELSPEILGELDAEYFKWKEEEAEAPEKKERRFLFGRKS